MPSIVGMPVMFLLAVTCHVISSTLGVVVAERGRWRAIWPPPVSCAAALALRLHKWSKEQSYYISSRLFILYLIHSILSIHNILKLLSSQYCWYTACKASNMQNYTMHCVSNSTFLLPASPLLEEIFQVRSCLSQLVLCHHLGVIHSAG